MSVVLSLLFLLVQGGVSTSSTPTIQRGVVVEPQTVTVGDPFQVIVRVRAPRGSVIEFPQAIDSGLKVESLDPVSVQPGRDTLSVEQTATYRVAAWDIGKQPIRFADIVVRQGADVRRLPFDASLSVDVSSVLPADSAQRVPKAPRALFEFGPPWWLWIIVALVAAAIIAMLWWWRTRRQRPAPAAPDAFAIAQREFARIEALELIASGERGQHVALITDVLRDYLSREISSARSALTTGELALALRGDRRVPLPRLVSRLLDVDLVKFAGASVSGERAASIGAEARAIVESVHDSVMTTTAQASAA